MARLSIGILGLTELLVSAAVHLLFGFYIFSTAVASDLSQALTDCFRPSVLNLATGDRDERGKRQAAALDGSPPPLPQPPIVLVHGIFGFGKGHHPVHFVGHSAGVQVARVLQQMLAEKVPPFPPPSSSSSSSSTSLNQTYSLLQAFNGYDTSEDWVLSITSLSGALNGTTRTYYDGMR
ncbi:hypothetical protein B296_00054384 [Ensete ventricosum]|uniref:Uncharacterized protein n=1 Tax=Ensete ventricosum TaxID=4639 RepID=A0A426XIE9_ENSVE|nr:hypothetical protein B296_00054384 [Ensete ventricosum]